MSRDNEICKKDIEEIIKKTKYLLENKISRVINITKEEFVTFNEINK